MVRGEEEAQALMQIGEERFYDDIAGDELLAHLVKEARKLEVHYFRQMKEYSKVQWAEAMTVTGKPHIKVRWVDVNKGDKANPNYRSRLVAKEIKTDALTEYFAAMPPLAALKVLLTLAATKAKPNAKGIMKQDHEGRRFS